MGKRGKGFTLAFFLLAFFCHAEEAVTGNFPVIRRLDSSDDGFKQFIADVEENRKRVFGLSSGSRRDTIDTIAASLTVYRYTPGEGEDLFFLAARCSIPYSTLASLNRLNHPSMVVPGRPLLLPSSPGIFVPLEPESDLELLLASSRAALAETDSAVLTSNGVVFNFFPGEELNATERVFFLTTGFQLPLRSYRLTSTYGMRRNPVSGNMRFHQGVDLAAPMGTEVYAAGNGTVTETGSDPIYGNYVVIKHGENWASLYGHLQKIGIALHSPVRSGMLIGLVGSTGQSTGPHLHFELRQNGKARDPDKYLFLPDGRQ